MYYGGNTCQCHPLPFRRWIMRSTRIVLLYQKMGDVTSTNRRDRVTHPPPLALRNRCLSLIYMEDEFMKSAARVRPHRMLCAPINHADTALAKLITLIA